MLELLNAVVSGRRRCKHFMFGSYLIDDDDDDDDWRCATVSPVTSHHGVTLCEILYIECWVGSKGKVGRYVKHLICRVPPYLTTYTQTRLLCVLARLTFVNHDGRFKSQMELPVESPR